MLTRILIIAVGAAWVAALGGLGWMVMLAGMRPHHLPYLLADMDIALKAFLALSVVSAIVGIVSVRAGARGRAVIGFAGSFGWGFVGGLIGAANARNMLINMNPPIPFAIYAPNYAEALIVLLVGLTGGLAGLALLSRLRPHPLSSSSGKPLRRRRPGDPAAPRRRRHSGGAGQGADLRHLRS